MKYVYPAIITPVENGEFDVVILDLPGCRTCGKDLADALYMAADAVAMWLWDTETPLHNLQIISLLTLTNIAGKMTTVLSRKLYLFPAG